MYLRATVIRQQDRDTLIIIIKYLFKLVKETGQAIIDWLVLTGDQYLQVYVYLYISKIKRIK